MTTFLILFFLLSTCIFWLPIAISWGLVKSFLFLIGGMFRSLLGLGVDAFDLALTNLLVAFTKFFIDSFSVVVFLWYWADANITTSIIFSIMALFLVFRTRKNEDFINHLYSLWIFCIAVFVSILLLLAGGYLTTSLVITAYHNDILFSLIYIISALAIGCKILIFLGDAMIDRNNKRGENYRTFSETYPKRFLLKLGERLFFIATVLFLVLLSATLYMV